MKENVNNERKPKKAVINARTIFSISHWTVQEQLSRMKHNK